MKKYKFHILLSIIIIVLITIIITLVMTIKENKKETQFCGKVVNCYVTPAGYKIHSEKHVVFYNDSLKRNIDVKVNNQTYANTVINEFICFDLNKRQLNE